MRATALVSNPPICWICKLLRVNKVDLLLCAQAWKVLFKLKTLQVSHLLQPVHKPMPKPEPKLAHEVGINANI